MGPTASCSQPTDYQILKMGVYDGVYQLDMSQADPNWAALHKEMGIPEADTKAMISGGNVHTMTVMENKDGSFTTSTNNTVVPHHNSSFTSKPGEIKKMEKPFPCSVSWNYRGENESVMNIEMGNGKKLVNEYCMNNYGFTCTTSMEGSSLKARAVFWKVSPKEDGYYEMETEKGMFPVLQQLMPQMTEDAWKELIKNGGVAMKLKVDKTKAVMEERMSGGKTKTVVYPFDEAVHYTNEEFGLDETRMLTRVAPGRYKMVTKTKTGKTGDYEMNFTEHGVFETMTVGGLSASCFYRRLGDFEGTWKVCSKVGAEGYLDACGMPEPMKSELLAANDVVEMKRLGGGKISTKSSSKFMPGENVMKLGEQWEIEMPGFGKMTGVFMEHGDCFSSCMKIGEKTINVKGKVTGDFIVEELDVDGSLASRMKQILVRQ